MTAPILVIEDDANVRGLMDAVLSSSGYQVVTAADGVAGLQEAIAKTPALVLLDLLMPDMGGAGVLTAFRQSPTLSAVPVLVVTGRAEALGPLGAQLGRENVFLKPFEIENLLARIAAVTGGPDDASPAQDAR